VTTWRVICRATPLSLFSGTARDWFIRAALLLGFLGTLARAADLSWEGSYWIWGLEPPGAPLEAIPAQACYFRTSLAVTERARIRSAELLVTADNLYEVSLNGQRIGGNTDQPNDWNRPKRFDVAGTLTAGDNTLAVEAVNTAPGPAGLILVVRVVLEDGTVIEKRTDRTWVFSLVEAPNWNRPDFNAQSWRPATELRPFGGAPWNRLPVPATAQPIESMPEAAGAAVAADFAYPDGLVFVGEDCSLQRPEKRSEPGGESLSVTVFTWGQSRAFPEHDLPGPIKVGRRLQRLSPARPGVPVQTLVATRLGALGSPTVSFDGQTIYFSMARDGDAFFHLYKIGAAGGEPVQLTSGPFHDIDPAELPDGRIVFVSTRGGCFEEYHNTPSRALFTMRPDGSDIRVLTSTFIFDNEPRVMPDGRILFIRSDNFFDRGKVETLLHAMHPDGTHGYTEFGLDLGPGYGNRLRAFYCGSPAPLPDGRVAYVTGSSIAVGRPGATPQDIVNHPLPAGEVAALPDGRLLCTLPASAARGLKQRLHGGYHRIAVFDPDQPARSLVTLYEAAENPIHSPVYLGPRPRPGLLASSVRAGQRTGILFCQDARLTRHTQAGWSHVKAIRVLMGKGLTMRSSHSYIVHAGNETVELGTVPLAPDGSFAVEVPADTAIAFQAVDAEGRAELNEMSWIYVRGGETRGCVGCHAPRQMAPPTDRATLMATSVRPMRLTGEGDPHRFRGNNAAVTGLSELQFDRFREVAGLNTPLGDTVELRRRLKDGDPERRVATLQRLALTRDLEAASAVASCLADTNREVRVVAALALAVCGTEREIPALERARHDPDWLVRQAATLALENFSGAEEGWIRRLSSTNRDEVRRAAVALGHRAAGEEARRALRDALVRWRNDEGYKRYRFQGDGAKFLAHEPANPRMIQEIIRALGRLKDREALPLLAETLKNHSDPDTGNLFVAEAAADALGLIGTAEAEAALITTFAGLKDYIRYTQWYGDHEALIACHASPVHYRILLALDRLGSTNAAPLAPHVLRCAPTDFDRALFVEPDSAEQLIARFIWRHGLEEAVVESCLALIGDGGARPVPAMVEALQRVHGAWAGTPTPENRAAQILSIVCASPAYAPRLQAAYARYMVRSNDIPRVFSQGIPVVDKLPARHWVCFYLGRALGRVRHPESFETLLAAVRASNEFSLGSPDPLGPGLIFLHNDLTPCWRAAAAWALGQLGDRRAIPDLLQVAGDFNNATETRQAAAAALGLLADDDTRRALRQLALNYPEVSTRQTLLQSARSPAVTR